MKTYTLWIVDDDKERIRQYKEYLKNENFRSGLIIKQFDVLMEAYDKEGSPDFVLIDTTSIMGIPTLYGCLDTAISICRGFAKKHTSANICIQSAVASWAKDIIKDIKDDFEECIVESIEADAEKFIQWIKQYIN